MHSLIEALTILSKYMDGVRHPTNCIHDELQIMCEPDEVSEEDIKRLEELSFFVNQHGGFSSYKFGSA